jgi:hypothetical protein
VLLRTGAVAHAFAAPGAAFAARALFERARASTQVLPRVFGTVFALLVALPAPWLPALRIDRRPTGGQSACGAEIDLLRALPTGTIFAPLDISPMIVARTPHAVVATGHHRNHAAMHDVISAFTGEPDEARAQIDAHHADYVAICPTAPEAELLERFGPGDFAAQLLAGHAPEWLEPVALGDGGADLLLYRVKR